MSEPTVFVVRVWRDATSFRATARPVDSDETVSFSEPSVLLRFLAPGATGSGADPAARGARKAGLHSPAASNKR
jgi:hypothetical protein